MNVAGLDHIVLLVRDLEASLRFYAGTLGLAPLRVEEHRQGKAPFPSVRVSNGTVVDLVRKERGAGGDNVDHFCLVVDVDDMERLAIDLRAEGVEVQGDVARRWGARGYGRSIYVKDPDGNTVELKSYSPS